MRLKTGNPTIENLRLSDQRKTVGIEASREHRAYDDAVDAARVYNALLETAAIA